MAMTETQRTTLYNQLTGAIGEEAARTLMEQLPPSGWDQVATKDDIKASEQMFTSQLREAEGRLMTQIANSETRQSSRIDATNTRLDDTTRELSELQREVRMGFAEMKLALARHTLWMAVAIVGMAASLAVPMTIALL